MTINEHVTQFAGLPVAEFDPSVDSPADPTAVAWRLSTDDDSGKEPFYERLDAFLGMPWVSGVRALVIGEWGESYETVFPVERFVAAADRLTSLAAIFVGEMTSEENEISWIQSTDLTPLLTAYPALQTLRARGGAGLMIQPGRYPELRSLAFEAGGLDAGTVAAVAESEFPRLNQLELWLGTANYGGDATVDDLGPILSGVRLPALASLGLRDAEIADAVAAALAGAPVVGRVKTLDLSLGMLTDAGAAALLAGQPLTHLTRLDLHHHFLSEDMIARVRDELEPAGVEVDLSDAKGTDDEDRRFIAVAE